MLVKPTCQGLLAQEALRLPVQLLDELAGQQAGVQDLHPAPDAILHQGQPQDGHLVLCPAGGGREVPPARLCSPTSLSLLR